MKKIYILLCITCALLLCGCGKDKEQSAMPVYTVGGSNVNIYYPKGDEIICDLTRYQLKQPDSIVASIEELMLVLSEKLGLGISYHTYMLDEENNLTLEFILDDSENRRREKELLNKAAVAKTLFQLEDIGNIQFNLTSKDGTKISEDTYKRDSFYFYGYDSAMGLSTVRYRIYGANDENSALRRRWMTVNPEPYESREQCIIDCLKKLKILPQATEIKATSLEDGICYIKFSKEFANQEEKIKSELVIYSVVNSLTSLKNIDKVMILVEGNNSGLYRGTIDLSKPLEFNESIVEERK